MMFRSPRDMTCWVTAPKYDKNETIELYGCDMCPDGGWTSETEVEIHKKMHYSRAFMKEMRKRDDYCYICFKKCLNKESVVKHIKTEHLLSTETCLRVEREIFICNKCSSIFFNKQNLYIHLRYAHLNMRNMQFIRCVLCMRKFKVSSMPAHLYSHNLQSVTTCRICLCKYKNTKALGEHLKTHPYYLMCDICCFITSRVETFHDHILLRHKNSNKINSIKNTKRNKNKLKGIQKKGKKKITTNSATAVEKVKDCAIDDTNLTENNENDIVKDLITLKYDDSLIKVEDLMSHQVKNDPDSNGTEMRNFTVINNDLIADGVIKNESTNSDLMIDEVMSDSNLMTVIEINDQDVTATDTAANTNLTEMGNFAVTNNGLMAEDVIEIESTNSDLMIDEVMSDSNLITVIEISDQDVTATDTADIDKDLITLKYDDNLIKVEDLLSHQVKDDPDSNGTAMGNFNVTNNDLMADDVIKNESTNSDLMIDEVMSDSNLMTVIEISDQDVTATDTATNTNLTEMGNFAVTNNGLMADDVIKNESTNSDLMIDEVMSDSNLITVIEISDQDVTATDTADIDKDLITLKYDDSLIKVEDLMSHQVKDDPDSNGTEMGNYTTTITNNDLMADDVIKNESTNSDLMIDEVMSDSNLMTVIEISDQDVTATDTAANTNLTENVTEMGNFAVTNNDLMADDVIKNESTNSDLMIDEVMSDSNLITVIEISDQDVTATDTADIDKDLITLKYDDSLIKAEDLMSHQVKDDPDSNGTEMGNFTVTNNDLMADDVIKNESTNSDLMIDEVMSDSNLMTVIEISDQDVTATDTAANTNLTENVTEMGNFAVTNNDLMADEVMSDSNLMTVIEISDQDVTATDTAANTNLTENVKTDKDFVINDGTINEVNVAADSNLTDTVNPWKDLVSKDITVTEVKIESDNNLTANVKPIKDLLSSDVIITKANTHNVVGKPVKNSEDFKRFFIPNSPTFKRLQRVVGIRGIRLSNDVHICILCREICVGFEEMRSHVDEHTVIVEKSNSYDCSCGEKFTFKILLNYHVFKTKHVISKLSDI